MQIWCPCLCEDVDWCFYKMFPKKVWQRVVCFCISAIKLGLTASCWEWMCLEVWFLNRVLRISQPSEDVSVKMETYFSGLMPTHIYMSFALSASLCLIRFCKSCLLSPFSAGTPLLFLGCLCVSHAEHHLLSLGHSQTRSEGESHSPLVLPSNWY